MSTCACTIWTRFSRLIDTHESGSSWEHENSGSLLTDEPPPSMDNNGPGSDLSLLCRASSASFTATDPVYENDQRAHTTIDSGFLH